MHESAQPGKLMLGGKPYPIDRLARALSLTAEVMSEVISTLLELDIARVCPDTGAIMCERMVKDRAQIEIRRAAGKMGGNPQLKKGFRNPYYPKDKQQNNRQVMPEVISDDKQKITPSVSSSSSSSLEDIHTPGEPSPKPEPATPKPKAERFVKPTIEETKAFFVVELQLPASDGEWFFHKCEGCGWTNGGRPIKSWKGTSRAWKAAGYIPSMKQSRGCNNLPPANHSREQKRAREFPENIVLKEI